MFQNLTNRITQTFRTFTGKDKITAAMVDDANQSLTLALLEADVAQPVIDKLLTEFKEKALNTPVPPEAKHGDVLVKIFHEQLVKLLGKDASQPLNLQHSPSVIMLVGLQGAGKTTFAARLGQLITQEHQKKVLLCSVDVYRPAAMEQLRILVEKTKAHVFASDPKQSPITIAEHALSYAKNNQFDTVILDTAGRTHIDDSMMHECKQLAKRCHPHELLFVIDSMSGQDALNTAKSFHQALPLTGLVLTKTDSDTRGGAAISAKYITEKPVRYITTGEKIEDIDTFDAERMAGRILGMGDIVSLMKELERKIDKEESARMLKKISGSGQFDFNDLKNQFSQLQSMGGMQNILSKLPMMGSLSDKMMQTMDENQFKPYLHLINSMTFAERAQPFLILNVKSRQQRILKGSGVSNKELKALISHFQKIQKTMQKMKGKKMHEMMARMQDMFGKDK